MDGVAIATTDVLKHISTAFNTEMKEQISLKILRQVDKQEETIGVEEREKKLRNRERELMALEDRHSNDIKEVDDGETARKAATVLLFTIGPRAIILQVIPILTPVAVYAMV